jgi:uncharacterized protein YidB (DUF937 family)
MGLFDELLRDAIGDQATDPERQSRGLVEALGAMLQEPEIGGVNGLQHRFEQTGLGPEANSWIGTGPNRSVSPEQMTQALGERRVESIASQLGLGRIAGATAIAALLPVLIDKLTPDGRAPQTGNLGGLLGGLLRGASGAGAARAEPPAPARPRADFSNVQSGSSSVPTPPQEQWYTVVAGDSLSKIAKRFYSDANQWRKIYDANRDQLENPDLIHPGQKLKIPTPAPQKSV